MMITVNDMNVMNIMMMTDAAGMNAPSIVVRYDVIAAAGMVAMQMRRIESWQGASHLLQLSQHKHRACLCQQRIKQTPASVCRNMQEDVRVLSCLRSSALNPHVALLAQPNDLGCDLD